MQERAQSFLLYRAEQGPYSSWVEVVVRLRYRSFLALGEVVVVVRYRSSLALGEVVVVVLHCLTFLETAGEVAVHHLLSSSRAQAG